MSSPIEYSLQLFGSSLKHYFCWLRRETVLLKNARITTCIAKATVMETKRTIHVDDKTEFMAASFEKMKCMHKLIQTEATYWDSYRYQLKQSNNMPEVIIISSFSSMKTFDSTLLKLVKGMLMIALN